MTPTFLLFYTALICGGVALVHALFAGFYIMRSKYVKGWKYLRRGIFALGLAIFMGTCGAISAMTEIDSPLPTEPRCNEPRRNEPKLPPPPALTMR